MTNLRNHTPSTCSKLLEVFSLFLGDDITRPVLQKPFEVNGKIYATDSYTLVRCDKSCCNIEITNTYTPPNVENIIPTPNTNKILNIEKKIFEQYRTIDEIKTIEKETECKLCDGFGYVEWEFDSYTKEDECPVCEGDGIIIENKEMKNGNKGFGNSLINLNGVYFKMDLFYKLIKTQDILGGDITLLYQSTTRHAVLFKVGECDVIIMPCLYKDTDKVDNILTITTI
jgi:hypothetical protein